MNTYFLDTSALAKRYVNELGSAWVRTQCRAQMGNSIIISQATLVEAVAAFCRKAREPNISQRISEADRDQSIRLFRQHVRRQYSVVRVTTSIYNQAGDLCRLHRLRAYDALQLASALAARNKLTSLGTQPPTFVSADAELLTIAAAEGLSIENPNAYP